MAREYLQARVLASLQDEGVLLRCAFVGGTALRFQFGLLRLSEGLDFSLIAPGEDASFKLATAEVRRASVREGYPMWCLNSR